MEKMRRRAFLADFGRGVTAALVLAACAPDSSRGTTSEPSTTTASSATGATSVRSAPETSHPTTASTAADAPEGADAYDWTRVDLGFVSAYLLVRSGETVLVDTGIAGSEGAIESVLSELGLDWDSVGHVIVTHEHPDHQGSVRQVLELATGATGHAARPDLENIISPRPFTEVSDGDMVEDLQIIATPGHTDGHISVLDRGRILLTGDAINNVDGLLAGPNPRFSSDMPTAIDSAHALARFDYEVALFGHGPPIDRAASRSVREMVDGL